MHPWVEIGGVTGLLTTLLTTRQFDSRAALLFTGLLFGEMGVSAAVAILGLVSGNELEVSAGLWSGTGVLLGGIAGAVINMARGNFNEDKDAWMNEEWKVEDWDWSKNGV